MKLKRIFLLVVLMPLLLAGCGGKDPEGGGELPPPTPVNPGGAFDFQYDARFSYGRYQQ